MPDFNTFDQVRVQSPLSIAPPFFPQGGGTDQDIEKVRLRVEGEEAWTLPLSPNISIEGQHHIIRRNVFKQHQGTLKERWTQDDYRLVMAGWLVGENSYPQEDITRLQGYFEQRKAIEITSKRLAQLNIQFVVFTQLHLPYTPGSTTQYYVLRGYSDQNDYALFE